MRASAGRPDARSFVRTTAGELSMNLNVAGIVSLLLFSSPVYSQQPAMSFFVTSVGLGKGGDLGGLSGADNHCQGLAQMAGASGKTWRAYLSTQGASAVGAKSRIGNGPWHNAKGVQIAADIADLHSDKNKINKETALD